MNKDIAKREFKQTKLMALNDESKAKFLEMYSERPNIAKIAKEIGVNRRTVQEHMKRDTAFGDAIDAIREEWLDGIEAYMIERSGEKSGFMDRIALLRAYRGDKYQAKTGPSVVINNNKDSINDLFTKIPKDKVIEAKVIKG